MIDKNVHELNLIKSKYHKKHGLLVFSGTLALEAALRIAGISKEDKVLFNNLACYSVLQAVVNVKATPVLMNPASNQIVLNPFEVIRTIKKEGVKCFIAIHQYGIYQEIEIIKKECPNTIVIEDLSQAWNVESISNVQFQFSDYLVFSLGKTKPLSLGIGGILLTNNDLLYEKTDLKDRDSRYKELPLISYMMPPDYIIDLPQIMITGDKNVNLQRSNAVHYKQIFSDIKYASIVNEDEGYQFSWHRYPIFVENEHENQFIELLKQLEIPYQKEFSVSLHQLKMAKGAIFIGNKSPKKLFLLRTRIQRSDDNDRSLNE